MYVRETKLATLALLCLAAATSAAPDLSPRIGYVYPAGGQQGMTFEATLGGQHLVEVANAYVSGKGVEAVVVPSVPTPTGREVAGLREQLKQLRMKDKDAQVRQEMREAVRKLAMFEASRLTPAIGERILVRITIAPDAAPGNREIRLATVGGLSNALAFQVGQLPEFSEPAVSQDVNWMQMRKSIKDPTLRAAPDRANRLPSPVTLPATLNGQLLPGQVDRFGFQARRGQKLVVAASARELLPYIADAVPGWVQLAVTLFDPQGRELACVDDASVDADPVQCYEIPAEGDYVLQINDALYRGREDFVYRVRVGELPWVTSIFPLGGPAGETTGVDLEGWNLAHVKARMDARDKKPGVYPLTVSEKNGGPSNLAHFEAGRLPEVRETEPNDSPQNAQGVRLPVVINGRIDAPGDVDVFGFQGAAGDTIVAEVMARRLGSPLDSVLTLSDRTGRVLASNDDHEDKAAGLITHHADSYLNCTLPATGKYYLRIADVQQKGGPRWCYRLRIGPPQPDFELRVVPSTINVRANATQPITVYALRRDGFSGEISLELRNAPPGFLLADSVIPAGKDQAQCKLSAPSTSSKTPVNLSLEGRATVQGRLLVRSAVPAQDMMQAFAYHHLVPNEDLLVAVGEAFPWRSQAQLLSPTPVRIPTQGAARVLLSMPRFMSFDTPQVQLVNPPEGITIKETSRLTTGLEIVIEADAAKVRPGLKGNLTVAFAASNLTRPGAPKNDPKRVPQGSLPAIPYIIVAPSPDPGKAPPLSVGPPAPHKVTLGMLPAMSLEIAEP